MSSKSLRMLIAGAAIGVAAGCGPVLAPQPDKSTFFVLAPLTSGGVINASAAVGHDPQLTLGIGPIEFPDYLSRLQVVTRTSANQIVLAQERRWGEPLDKNFARVFSENISLLMNTQQIEKYPWSHKTQIDYQIEIDVLRFEAGADGQSQMVARWIIKDGATGKDLYASETTASAPVPKGDAGASIALSDDLATLSRDVATHLVALNQTHKAPSSVQGLSKSKP